ncbi:D-glycero-alpha-D-manno-heptose-7-phosphate kinase [Paucidesulfovibrio gracilis DSM 16080]|uniref:D-glycero-alpha-D-manno-heptose-7-phosphate kinase n=1 Tax=Paucidesulfovibrio gracilis DSM 16080 TaxID=1121449 RepID=A0A1T4XDL6_9BACT|nr:dehydrogenase [Paucidesulfovibrio gracilis]SKA87650.1 D-glycero-alpha-D-manno-heptose-7-phosphate kinase [Paucidesulfovibrio gracilis DSM 16080]
MPTYIRAKAPLRLGLGGGGTDIVDYSSRFGGAIINTTISRFAHATVEPLDDGTVEFQSMDRGRRFRYAAAERVEPGEGQRLLAGVYNRMVRDFAKRPLSFRLTTAVDAPPGSGLGSSSTLVVAIVGAFCEWLQLPLGPYEIAELAYDIERVDLGLAGGKQDQFAATFGGFNFMEFHREGSTLVNPLRVRQEIVSELEHNLLLLYTSVSRDSATIIEDQKRFVQENDPARLEALHGVKRVATEIKKHVLTGDLNGFGRVLRQGWESKKQSSDIISNPRLDRIFDDAFAAGALGGKISGAGGGGFMMLYCPGVSRYAVLDALASHDVRLAEYRFVDHGLLTWRRDEP